MNQTNKNLVWMILGAGILLGATLLGIGLDKAFPMKHYTVFGPQQTPEAVVARYDSCKEHAPKGMDCVMIPMLVSDEFMKQYGEK